MMHGIRFLARLIGLGGFTECNVYMKIIILQKRKKKGRKQERKKKGQVSTAKTVFNKNCFFFFVALSKSGKQK